MKLLLLIPLFLLTSCQQYQYTVQYEKCNGQTGSVQYRGISYPRTDTYKQAVPILRDAHYNFEILNVCDFSYTAVAID